MSDLFKNNTVMILGSLVVIFILIYCLFFIPVKPTQNQTLRALQIEETKLSIALLKRELSQKNLTTKDLKAIYDCVDQKIANQAHETAFPCVAIRGDKL